MLYYDQAEREASERAESELLRKHASGMRPRRIETRSMTKLREARGNRCRRCRARSRLEFAHIKETALKGRGRGQMHRYCDIKKNPDCYELLCYECHREFDRRGGYRIFCGLLFVEWL